MEKEGKSTSFFKNFGMGLVYTIVFPLIVVASLVYGIICVFEWIIKLFPRLIRFFKGEEFYPALREDKEVALVMKTQHERMLNGIPPSESNPPAEKAPSAVYVQNNYYTQAPASPTPSAPTFSPQLNQGMPQYVDATGTYVQNQIPTQNPANPTLISQNPAQIPNNANMQNGPTLVAIPTYRPEPEAREIKIDPLGDETK